MAYYLNDDAEGTQQRELPFPGALSPRQLPHSSSSRSLRQVSDSSTLSAFVNQARQQQDRARTRNVSGYLQQETSSSGSQSNTSQSQQNMNTLQSEGDSNTRQSMERSSSMSSNLSMSNSISRRMPPPPLDLSNSSPASTTSSGRGTFATSRSMQDLHRAQQDAARRSTNTARSRTSSINATTTRQRYNTSSSFLASPNFSNGPSLPKSESSESDLSLAGPLLSPGDMSDNSNFFGKYSGNPEKLKAPAAPFMKRSESSSSSSLSDTEGRARERRDTVVSASSSPRSPSNVDRSRLIGLAELSTPRWKATGHTSWTTPFLPTWEMSPQPPVPETPVRTEEESPVLAYKPQSATSLTSPATGKTASFSPSSRTSSLTRSPSSPSNAINAIDNLLSTLETDEEHFKLWEASQQNSAQPVDPHVAAKIGLGFAIPHASNQAPPSPNEDNIGVAIDTPDTSTLLTNPYDANAVTQTITSARTSRVRSSRTSLPGEKEKAKRVAPKEDELASTAQRNRKVSATSDIDQPYSPAEKSPRSSTHSRRQSAGGISTRSHHSSKNYGTPSHIAHSILRVASTTHDGAEIESVAANDGGTAQALRKLDGLLPSPKAMRGSVTPRSLSDARPRLKTRGSNNNVLDDSQSNSQSSSPALPSPGMAAVQSSAQRRSQDRERDSTLSAAYFATGRDLRESGAAPSPTTEKAQRLSKTRRTSASSDVSSFSETSARRSSADAAMAANSLGIPPVPPLPKDWERRASLNASSPLISAKVANGQNSATTIRATNLLSPSVSSPAGLDQIATLSPTTKASSKKWSFTSALGMNGRASTQAPVNSEQSQPAASKTPTLLQSPATLPSPASSSSLSDFPEPYHAGKPSSPSVSSMTDKTGKQGSRQTSNTRVTPSGIPFFSRKSSAHSKISLESSTSDASMQVESSPSGSKPVEKEKKEAGRKSILGITFLGRKGDRVSTQQASPTLPPSSSFSSRLTKPLLLSPQKRTPSDELTPARKRGKTLPSGEAPKVEPTYLPPMQISAIPQTTARRIEDRARTQADAKSTLPTIAGSPSVQVHAETINETPTRIPRKVKESSSPMPANGAGELGEWKSRTAQLTLPTVHSLSTSLQEKSMHGPGVNPSIGIGRTRRTSSSNSISSIPRSTSTSTLNADRSTRTIVPPSTAAAMNRHVKRLSVNLSEDNKPGTPLTNRLSGSRSSKLPVNDARAIVSPSSSATKHIRRLSNNLKSITSINQETAMTASRSSRALSDKLSIPTRITKSTTMPSLHRTGTDTSPSSSSSRNATPAEEEDSRADQEMAQYVKRVTAKKLASGMSSGEIRRMFEFPAATTPSSGLGVPDVLHKYAGELSDYEREEILDYKHAWYLGQGSSKVMATRANAVNNYGYDDDRGDYQVIMHDHILFRYEITGTLGKGSFGQVLQCRDHKTGEMVAVKIIRNKKRFHHQALVEIKVLENLRKWDPDAKHNVIQMTESFSFRSHLCIVTELLSINLYELIKANNFTGFSTTLIRRFTVQMLNALTLLRHHRVVHCDLKPENVLLKHPSKSGVQVIDFGSSCFENEKVYTYIQSRFYRSVEVILGSNYHMAIDMWSLGCIMAELYTGMPLFPGEDEQEQLACIIEVLGIPDRHLVERSSRRKLFFDSTGAPRPVVNSKGRRRRPGAKSLAAVLKCDDELFVDFIAKCLVFDPDRRLKPQAALRHPFIRPELRAVASPAPSTRLSRSSAAPSVAPSLSSSSISTPRRRTTALSSSVTPSHVSPAYPVNSAARTRHPTSSSLPLSGHRVSIK